MGRDGMLVSRITSSIDQDYNDPDIEEVKAVLNGDGINRDCWFEGGSFELTASKVTTRSVSSTTSHKVGPAQLPDSMDAMDLEDWGVIFEPFPPSSEYKYRVKVTIRPGSEADKAFEWTNVRDGMLVSRITSSIDQDYNDPDIEEVKAVLNGDGINRDCWFEG